MPVKKLKDFLDSNNVKYTSISHSPAYTAQEIAQKAHIPGEMLAKTVILKINDAMAMVIVPATNHVDIDLLKPDKYAGTDNIKLASESDFEDAFPGCEVGAMSPFGNLYDMPVYVAKSLGQSPEIVFSAGSHNELVQINYDDFIKLVNPKIIDEM